MFLGKNPFSNQGGTAGAGSSLGVGDTGFLNQAKPLPMGMQRFLAKKGINSFDDLTNRVQFAPRMPFRKIR
ncbi:hypothetical protein [Desulfosporosinus fructosivorans]